MSQAMFDVISKTMTPLFHKRLKEYIHNYDTDPKYKILKIEENNELQGFCIYYDELDYRVLSEIHYIGKNPYAALKMYKWAIKGAKTLIATVQKFNTKVLKTYFKLGFEIINQDNNHYLLEKKVV